MMPHDRTCIFCKIVARTAPSSVLYEDDRIMAFMNIRPVNTGEFLLIPKEHIDHFCDLPDDLSSHLKVQAQRLSRNLRERLRPKRVGMVVHGFGVAHAHLNVVPLHDSSDIVSAKYARIETGRIKFDFKMLPETARAELDRLAELLG